MTYSDTSEVVQCYLTKAVKCCEALNHHRYCLSHKQRIISSDERDSIYSHAVEFSYLTFGYLTLVLALCFFKKIAYSSLDIFLWDIVAQWQSYDGGQVESLSNYSFEPS